MAGWLQMDYKSRLISELWLPKAKEHSKVLRPKLKKNKRLRVLTLTSDADFQEVTHFIKEGLSTKSNIIIWTYSLLKRLRFQADGFKVPIPRKFEDAVLQSASQYSELFPLQVANLDFVSQDPTSTQGRIEREIESVEGTVKLQRECHTDEDKGLILIFTTKIDAIIVDVASVKTELDNFHALGWPGLDISGCGGSAATADQKAYVIKRILEQITRKYGYGVMGYDSLTFDDIHSVVIGMRDHV